MPGPELSLILPFYNEGACLSESLQTLLATLARIQPEFELICVDDGSSDDSAEIATAIARNNPRIQSISTSKNLGKGAAIQRGIQVAEGRWIATIDADLSTDLEAVLPLALEKLQQGAALVIGNRRLPASTIKERQPFVREFLGRSFGLLAGLSVGGLISDYTCGFKAYRNDAARRIFTDLETARWAFDVELIAIARSLGLRIEQLPVIWAHRSDTRVRLPGDAFQAFVDVIRIGWNFRTGGYRQP
ncbi:MAG: dolichyl-phosphate beta-glucosyltransferase [Planctomycetota bacterium]|jgi:dolichyl-phosphate beta-glucosyltransferase